MELNISIIITAIAGRMHCNVVQLKLIKLNSSINNARTAANTWDKSVHIISEINAS